MQHNSKTGTKTLECHTTQNTYKNCLYHSIYKNTDHATISAAYLKIWSEYIQMQENQNSISLPSECSPETK